MRPVAPTQEAIIRDKYGLIGYPLGHSFSIGYFNEKFQNEGIDACYINFEIPSIDDLHEVLDSNPELCGLNVTIPYKQKVIPYLDEVSTEARAIGAVNVIRVSHKGRNVHLKGFNSDPTTKRLSSWAQAALPKPSTTDSAHLDWKQCS